MSVTKIPSYGVSRVIVGSTNCSGTDPSGCPNSSGIFRFIAGPDGKPYPAGAYTLTVIAEGYNIFRVSFYLPSGSDVSIQVGMIKSPVDISIGSVPNNALITQAMSWNFQLNNRYTQNLPVTLITTVSMPGYTTEYTQFVYTSLTTSLVPGGNLVSGALAIEEWVPPGMNVCVTLKVIMPGTTYVYAERGFCKVTAYPAS
jgi:hypothetical protein